MGDELDDLIESLGVKLDEETSICQWHYSVVISGQLHGVLSQSEVYLPVVGESDWSFEERRQEELGVISEDVDVLVGDIVEDKGRYLNIRTITLILLLERGLLHTQCLLRCHQSREHLRGEVELQ